MGIELLIAALCGVFVLTRLLNFIFYRTRFGWIPHWLLVMWLWLIAYGFEFQEVKHQFGFIDDW